MPSASLVRPVTLLKPRSRMWPAACDIVKLLAPFAGIGASACVVATAWLLLPEAVFGGVVWA
jgi:hypothetical protein